MSQATQHTTERKRERVREMLREDFTPHDTSKQALYHEHDGKWRFEDISQRHHDGEQLYKDLGLKPFDRVLEKAAKTGHPVHRFPDTFLSSIIHTDDRDLLALEEGDLDYFAEQPRTRQRVMAWLADHPEVVEHLDDGGREIHGHSKPGKGKTSFVNVVGVGRNLEVNNDTILWMLMGDESGAIDEFEMLPVVRYMTALVPKDVEIQVTANPVDYRLPEVEVELDDVFRDVVEYEDPVDLFDKVVPGGLYGVLPDPQFRGCERIMAAAYNHPGEVDEPGEVTPLRDFVFAVHKVRAKYDVYLHPTTLIVDEFGDLLPKNPEADASDKHRKVTDWPATYGKMRKKNGSLFAMSHSLKRVHEDVLEKERWFATFPMTPTPSPMSGLGEVGLPKGYTKHMNKGQAAIWNGLHYAPVSWPNPYRGYEFNGEISISYPEWQEGMSDV
ncbi:hypothetical protein ACFQH6_19370 [Halobacteriaceae archaeon GCM10025711]